MKLRVVATAIGAAAVALVVSSPASAQVVLSKYDHKDPYRSGCASVRRVVETAKINSRANGQVGTIRLMWSSKCKTNWIETTTPRSANGTISVYTAKKHDSFSFKSGRSKHWGNMLEANNVCAWGSVSIQWNGGRGGQNGSGATDRDGACR
ncbi:DUF2690 domain-containing protein [Nonomuraea basaltis]|uniref:DUF2690 domain-containing protein n=1 Tax=Nonomuraea basaltis TaxID=2495887 RepID=UPI0014860C2F|nr:DUF2690 domain-containing protein [Nonomuraea basaltis]